MRSLALAALLSLPMAAAAYPQFGSSGSPNVTGIGKTIYSAPRYNSQPSYYGPSYNYNHSPSGGRYGSSYGSSYGNSYSSPRY
jgi:hypothetical protein